MMKLTKTIVAFAALAAGALQAQTSSGTMIPATTATTTPMVGVLGQNYADVNFGFNDVRHTNRDDYHATLSGNQAVSPNLDAQLGYAYGWLQHSPRGHNNEIDASAITYMSYDGMKPFAMAQLGYEWDNLAGHRTNFGNWGGGVGVEIPAGVVSITPAITYADDFQRSSKSSQAVSYGASANYWVSRTTAVYAGVDYADVRKSDFDYWNYNAGLRLKF